MKETRYADAGVDISAANEAKKRIASAVRSTHGPQVLGDIGGFGGLFDAAGLPPGPVLVASTDGVGTKLKIAFKLGRHRTVGQDIVNHCVNDILVQGARPLFFLDYLATGRLEPGVVQDVVEGVAAACRVNGCALLGGETAEMPGFYPPGEYDLAGTIVGVVARASIVTGAAIAEGDVVLGLASSGLHTNGYSLARKVLLEDRSLPLDKVHPDLGRELGEVLLEPHRTYAPAVLPLLQAGVIRGMVHITGGGFGGNIPRVVPPTLRTVISSDSWTAPPVFGLISRLGNVPRDEMFSTFNMGLGMLLIVPASEAPAVRKSLSESGEEVFRVGFIEPLPPGGEAVVFS